MLLSMNGSIVLTKQFKVMMKAGFIVLGIAASIGMQSFAQTPINKTIPYQAGQVIVMHFDYPELIRVSTWDKNEVSITGTVSINNGENDNAFELSTSNSGKEISIRNEIKGLKSLPQRITIVDGTQKITFKTKDEFRKYQQEHGRSFERYSMGVDMDISIEVKVPRNSATRVESVYGIVEVRDFSGPLTVDATYGGVDAALVERTTGAITAQTNFGEIYTNLDAKFGGDGKEKDFYVFVSAKPGTGPNYSLESKYGNVYIRKAQ